MRTLIRTLLISCFALTFTVGTAAAQTVIAETSFEVPSTGGQYTDTGDASVDHDLVNNPGEAPVDFTASGGEIGFDSRYVNTRGSSGLTDGDFVGVTDFTGAVGSFVDGSQGFQIGDPDGKMVTEFDAVDLTGSSAPHAGVSYFINDTGYESTDLLRIYVRLSGGAEVDLVNLTGDDIDADDGSGNANEGQWIFTQVDLSAYIGEQATFIFELDSNSSSEAVYIDQVQFTSDAPLPVELSAFTASTTGDKALLEWTTATETNNAGFAVEHQAPGASFEQVGFVGGNGTTDAPTRYRFTTKTLAPGVHAFRLRQVDIDGTETLTQKRTVTVTGRALTVSGPNPLRAGQQAKLTISAPTQQDVQVALYNVLGQQVKSLYTGIVSPTAPARVAVQTDGLASGMYFLRVTGATINQTERLTVVR